MTGGIAINILVKGNAPAKRLNLISEMYNRYTGRDIFIDNPALWRSLEATLAKDGINQITGQRALPLCHIRDLLTVMHTCGMDNFAGQWACKAGIEAKGGVGD